MSDKPTIDPIEPIQEEALDKMIDLIEGPLNKLGEKIFSSTIVLAPLSLSMNLSMRLLARVLGKKENRS
ncbi:MAG TPA: hypothetical protein VGO62_20535 [Myxococcota bacterium]|jgi:hypothetical protein